MGNKTMRALGVAALIAGLGLGAASAQEPLVKAEEFPGEFSANVGFVSEYVFRGVSQSDDNVAIQGGFDYSLPVTDGVSFYAGIWGSNVDFASANIETDLYGGISGEIAGGFGWDIGVIYYAYPSSSSRLDYDYVEIKGALSYDAGAASATAAVYYSPEFFGKSGDAVYYALDVDVPVGKYVVLSGHVGHQDIQRNAVFGLPDYTDYSIGASVNLFGFDVGLAWTDTDMKKSECDDLCGIVVFSVSRSF